MTNEYIYVTNDKFKLDKYVDTHFIVEKTTNISNQNKHTLYSKIKPINEIKDNNLDKINKEEYSINTCSIS